MAINEFMMELIAMKSPTRPFGRWWLALLPGILLASFCLPVARGDELTRQVQEELRRRNLYFGDVDGRYTTQIAAALRRYQQRKGFAATGEVDETTLRSLSLLAPVAAGATPAATVAAAASAAAANTTTMLPPVPWPDLPVLHSDQGRVQPLPEGDAEPITDPTPKPPPLAVAQRQVDDTGVRAFVSEYLRSGQSNQPGTQDNFYAKRVDYFNEGMVDGAFIGKDTARYNKRWPTRHFILVDPVTVAASPDGDPQRLTAEFRCQFVVRSGTEEHDEGKTVRGETKNTYVLERVGPGPDDLKIVAIKEERVRVK